MQKHVGSTSPRLVTWLVAAAAVVAILVGLAATSEASDSAPAAENLQLVLDERGFVDRLDWDPPAGASPSRFDVNYRFANEAPNTAQVFWSTRNTHLTAAESFGSFVECEAGHHPSDRWIVWVTYPTPDGQSGASNQISMCFP